MRYEVLKPCGDAVRAYNPRVDTHPKTGAALPPHEVKHGDIIEHTVFDPVDDKGMNYPNEAQKRIDDLIAKGFIRPVEDPEDLDEPLAHPVSVKRK